MLVRFLFALVALVAVSATTAQAAPLTDQQFNALCPSERQTAIATFNADLDRYPAVRPDMAAAILPRRAELLNAILSEVRKIANVPDAELLSPGFLARVDGEWDKEITGEIALTQRDRVGTVETYRRMKVYTHCAILARQNTLRPAAGSQNPPLAAGSAPVGKNLRAEVLAGDGTSAMGCVNLMDVAARDSSTSGGGRVLANRCSGTVAVFWCYVQSGGSCGEWGEWNIGVNNSWPVSREKEVRYGACMGPDTMILDKSRQGTRFACRAPQR